MTHNDPVHIQLATPERWADLVDLFGPERGRLAVAGACGRSCGAETGKR